MTMESKVLLSNNSGAVQEFQCCHTYKKRLIGGGVDGAGANVIL